MNSYVFTSEEQADLNSIIENLRTAADELERVSTIRESIYIPGITHNLNSILDGYREVLKQQERALYDLKTEFYDRRINK